MLIAAIVVMAFLLIRSWNEIQQFEFRVLDLTRQCDAALLEKWELEERAKVDRGTSDV